MESLVVAGEGRCNTPAQPPQRNNDKHCLPQATGSTALVTRSAVCRRAEHAPVWLHDVTTHTQILLPYVLLLRRFCASFLRPSRIPTTKRRNDADLALMPVI